ncbi:ABC transporter ATP-binding protein [Acidithiobacillus ferrooxidans]|uniref:ABC transporter ATP-binding protein n=1 Tax=Acidithiobacillus ferrooxidans TaxID=920 RepID=UPI001C079757|nr:ABC transporter ATP-binding protein [Acidithiobacillus ferrooxidans]MBU2774824.1 ABC transporter ATP-binding protein [Acidithiobacillus ferrooxidans]
MEGERYERETLIKLDDLSKVYHENPVFSRINCEISRGDFICVVGPSGSGKTTLLRCLLGVEKISSGFIYQESDGIRFTYVPQQPTLLPWRSALENVVSGIFPGVSDPKAQALEILKLVGLVGKENALPRQLSGGMQQRVSFARALASAPDIVFMDEPFSALDEMRRAELGRLVFDLWQRSGVTFVMNTHSIEDASILSTKVWVMTPAKDRTGGASLRVLDTWPRTESFDSRKASDSQATVRAAIEREISVVAA